MEFEDYHNLGVAGKCHSMWEKSDYGITFMNKVTTEYTIACSDVKVMAYGLKELINIQFGVRSE